MEKYPEALRQFGGSISSGEMSISGNCKFIISSITFSKVTYIVFKIKVYVFVQCAILYPNFVFTFFDALAKALRILQ